MGIHVRGRDFYPAIVSREGRMFEARFLDFPNCVAAGATAKEAEVRAEAALSTWVEMARRFARPLPVPSKVETDGMTQDRYVAFIRFQSPRPAV